MKIYVEYVGLWYAVDSDTYCGAPDSTTNIVGSSDCRLEAIFNLLDTLKDAGIYTEDEIIKHLTGEQTMTDININETIQGLKYLRDYAVEEDSSDYEHLQNAIELMRQIKLKVKQNTINLLGE